MRKKWKNIILGTVMTVMCCMTGVQPAIAGEQPDVSVPVTVTLTGTLPEKAEDFEIVLNADDEAFPMPEGAENGSYIMTITGEGTKSFPEITYDRVGIYTYTISQNAGTNEKCTYDSTLYTLDVYVTNAEDGDGLETTVVLYTSDEKEKYAEAGFMNAYEVVPTATPEPTATPTITAAPTSEPEATATVAPTTAAKKDNATKTSTKPKTGDESRPALYAVLALACIAVIAGIIVTKRKKEN